MKSQLLEEKADIINIKNKKDFIFKKLDIDGYENVYKIINTKTKLLAIVSIHNSSLGKALGGTRILPYDSFDEALNDALRLSKGMTYKSAISEVGFGGGKSVIITNNKTKELLRSFGEAIEALGGDYICAEDMGCTTEDVMEIRKVTKYVVGLSHEKSSGDPGRFTAWGVYRGIQATLHQMYGSESIEGKTIAVQGIGNVGHYLLEYLFWAGANLIITDIDEKLVKTFSLKYGAKSVKPEDIYKQQCDIFAPCAKGGIINDKTILELNCKAVVGSANNQLLEEKHASALREKNILYAPDFVVNAGGLLNVAIELDEDGYDPKIAYEKTNKIYDVLLVIYEIAKKNKITTNEAAKRLADYRIKYGIGKRKVAPYYHDHL